MKILNYGSMNLDHVYSVPHFVNPGETILAMGMNLFCGGKGLNQSIAVAKAGGTVYHAGIVGDDGDAFVCELQKNGVDTSLIRRGSGASSHTVIQVDPNGQNSIIVFSGVNMRLSEHDMDEILAGFEAGDMIMLQNELYGSPLMMKKAAKKGLTVLLNPSPADDNIRNYPLDKVNWFILNEIEGALLTNEHEPAKILEKLRSVYPHASVVLTLGSDGAYLQTENVRLFQHAFNVPVVDTTAAGDTFTGYFIAGLAEGQPYERIMKRAALAAAIAVSRPGAADSVPLKNEVDQAESENLKQ